MILRWPVLRTLGLIVSCWLISTATLAAKPEQIPVYAYHLKPPFIVSIAREQGLYYDFTRFLNSQTKAYNFYTVFVPRKRIERLLNDNQLDGILVGVNPKWFDDPDEETYLWTEKVFTDFDDFVSLKSNPIDVESNKTLAGLTLGGVAGFFYYGVDKMITNNELKRVDTVGEREVLQLVQKGRADVGIVSRSTYKYLAKHEDWLNIFYISSKPHDMFERKVLIPKTMKSVYPFVSRVVSSIPQSKEWQNTVDNYQ